MTERRGERDGGANGGKIDVVTKETEKKSRRKTTTPKPKSEQKKNPRKS